MDRALGMAANSGKFGMKVLLNQARLSCRVFRLLSAALRNPGPLPPIKTRAGRELDRRKPLARIALHDSLSWESPERLFSSSVFRRCRHIRRSTRTRE